MSVRCKHVQQALAASTAEQQASDPVLQEHVRDCVECAGIAAALLAVDDELFALPPINPPEQLVDRILAKTGSVTPAIHLVHSRPRPDATEQSRSPAYPRDARIGRAVAMGSAFAAAAAVAVISFTNLTGSDRSTTLQTASRDDFRGPVSYDHYKQGTYAGEVEYGAVDGSRAAAIEQARTAGQLGALQSSSNAKDVAGRPGGGDRGEDFGWYETTVVEPPSANDAPAQTTPGDHRLAIDSPPDLTVDKLHRANAVVVDPESTTQGITIDSNYRRNIPVPGRTFEAAIGAAAGAQGDGQGRSEVLDGAQGADLETRDRIAREETLNEAIVVSGQRGARVTEDLALKTPAEKPEPTTPAVTVMTKSQITQSTQARGFIAEREKLVGVPTVAANGFWSNNYIPGDPQLRLLAARLAGDPSAAQLGSLDASVAPYAQLFDAPKSSALAVSVRSDHRAVDGPSRMLIQVGLKGTDRQAGGRTALNIGIVLDLGNTPDEAATAMRGLLSALRDARRRGDRFSLTVANRGGGLVLTPDQFRNGPLRVAMQQLFANEPDPRETLSLGEAVARATAQITATDDPSGPLGRSMVLIVTASPVSPAVDRQLQALAHANAVNGIATSTIGVGTAIDDGQLLGWAAAGHGNRRLLLRADDASATIARELAAAESVVARAVRVRVKLAPGVKLVEVVGSKRLGAMAAARTREAEISIDRRVAKASGIEADRENDEDGIKIIIPSFSAGDAHVILLDVIADGPGALADVAVSYKDLVHLRNGTAKAALSLGRGHDAAERDKGHIERSIFQNYVGSTISQRLGAAGALLQSGDTDGASAVVAQLHDLLEGLQLERPWLRRDVAFVRDVATVKRFNDVMQAGVAEASRAYVANSLSYASWRKIVTVRRETN